MAADTDPVAELIGLEPDPRLLGEDLGALPASLGRPAAIPPSRLGERLVTAGAAMTGVTLTAGALLLGLAAILALTGGSGPGALAALLVGIGLTGTHWGWVHVAEISSQRLEHRGNRELIAGRKRWLAEVEPYTRYAVSTRALADGSVEIITVRHSPRRASPTTFTFERSELASERHAPDEGAAAVTERAELLRSQTAQATECARERYAAVAGERQSDRMRELDEGERIAAERAAAEALSEQINANLRSAPLE